MAEGKQYFWLKLKDDFFSSKRIKKLRKLAGGDTYTIIYLKLQLLAMKKDGLLVFTGLENTVEEELALDLDEDPANVRITLNYLLSCGLCECSDDINFFFPYAVENVGKEASSTKRVREFRERQKALHETLHETQPKQIGNGEIEKEIEIETELEKSKSKNAPVYVSYAENVKMTEDEYTKLLDQFGLEAITRMIEILDNYKGQSGKKYKSDYRAILNWVVDRWKEEQEHTRKPAQGKAPLQTYQGGEEEMAMLRRLQVDDIPV